MTLSVTLQPKKIYSYKTSILLTLQSLAGPRNNRIGGALLVSKPTVLADGASMPVSAGNIFQLSE